MHTLISNAKAKGYSPQFGNNEVDNQQMALYLEMCVLRLWLQKNHSIFFGIMPIFIKNDKIVFEYEMFHKYKLADYQEPFDKWEEALQAALESAINILNRQ